LDVANVFASGQSYVAFSRLKSLSGLVLTEPYRPNQISNAHEVTGFENEHAQQSDLDEKLANETRQYLKQLAIQVYDFTPLYRQWNYHLSSYNKVETHSEKQRHRPLITEQLTQLLALEDSSRKFITQLEQMFNATEVDYTQILSRLKAAFNYYEERLKDVISELVLLRKKMEKLKRTKSYVNELNELDAQLMRTLYQMHKARQLCESLITPQSVYIEQKYYPEWRAELDATKPEPDTPAKPPKVKGETYLTTLALFRAGKTLEEIAEERKLSPGTISSHFEWLIKMGKITIEECLGKQTIEEISKAAAELPSPNYGALYAHFKEKYSYSDIKIVMAQIEKQSKESGT
jgi:hypothetical protein